MNYLTQICLLIILLGQSIFAFADTQNFNDIKPHLIKALECRNWRESDASNGLNVRTLPVAQLNLTNIPGVKIQYIQDVIAVELPQNISVYGTEINYFQLTVTGADSQEPMLHQVVNLNPGDINLTLKNVSTALSRSFKRINENIYSFDSDQHHIFISDESQGDAPMISLRCVIKPGVKGSLENTEAKSDFYASFEAFNIAQEKIKKELVEKERIAKEQARILKEKEAQVAVDKDMLFFDKYTADVKLYKVSVPIVLCGIGLALLLAGLINLLKVKKLNAYSLSFAGSAIVFFGAGVLQYLSPIFNADYKEAEAKWIDMYKEGHVFRNATNHSTFMAIGEMIGKSGSQKVVSILADIYHEGAGIVVADVNKYRYFHDLINVKNINNSASSEKMQPSFIDSQGSQHFHLNSEKWQRYNPNIDAYIDLSTVNYHQTTDNGRILGSVALKDGKFLSTVINFYCAKKTVFVEGYFENALYVPWVQEKSDRMYKSNYQLSDENTNLFLSFICPKIGQPFK